MKRASLFFLFILLTGCRPETASNRSYIISEAPRIEVIDQEVYPFGTMPLQSP